MTEVTAQTGLFTHVNLYVEDSGGPGRPVVLIHGWPLSGASWSDLAPVLEGEGYRVVAAADGREALVCGDWNIAHREADLKNWKANRKKSGFLPEERAWLSRVFEEAGYVDVVRALHPDVDGPYTWWSQRGKAFDTDTGWRIDYHMASPALAATARDYRIDRASAWDTRWSDHAPVIVDYHL
jgi:exodeoxyribonuclease-3